MMTNGGRLLLLRGMLLLLLVQVLLLLLLLLLADATIWYRDDAGRCSRRSSISLSCLLIHAQTTHNVTALVSLRINGETLCFFC
uniref:Putative secreted protein n=1 Tax=Anopheles darlingi TaxID=43151 RepID=A0A2M4D6Z7_ANODA